MRLVARLVKRGCLSVLALVVCLIVMVVSAGKYAANRHSFPENTASWGQSGNYIMGYGPVREPYLDTIKNTYQVFPLMGNGWMKRPNKVVVILLLSRHGKGHISILLMLSNRRVSTPMRSALMPMTLSNILVILRLGPLALPLLTLLQQSSHTTF